MKTHTSDGKMNGNKPNFKNTMENIRLLNNLDLDNTISFIGNDDRSTYDLLYKIKVTINLLFNNDAFMELLRYSIRNNDIGKKLTVGNSLVQNFIITSIMSNDNDAENYVIVMKYFQKIHSLRFTPGTINSITLKKFRINDIMWENKAEISFVNRMGVEYNLKISFFRNN
ncbi:hypothetical protein ES705_03566 [subsurface metagenome]